MGGQKIIDGQNEAIAVAKNDNLCGTCGGEGKVPVTEITTDRLGHECEELVGESYCSDCPNSIGIKPEVIEALRSGQRVYDPETHVVVPRWALKKAGVDPRTLADVLDAAEGE